MQAPDHADLMQAIRMIDAPRVRALIARGVDVNQNNGVAWHRACFDSDDTIVDLLIEAGADVRAFDDYGLRSAAGINSLDRIRKFIALGANPNANHGQATANVISHSNVEALQFLLESGADPNLNRGKFLCDASISDEFADEMLAVLMSFGGKFEPDMRFKEHLEIMQELDFEPLDLMVKHGLDVRHPSINELAEDNARLKAWQDRKILEINMGLTNEGNPEIITKSAVKRSAGL